MGKLCKRRVCYHGKSEVKFFHNYVNAVSTLMKLTKELEKARQLTFLNENIQQLKDEPLATSINRKPTHTYRYLQYPANQKVNVACALFSRANKITTNNKIKI